MTVHSRESDVRVAARLGRKLWIRATVVNGTNGTLTVVRDAVTAHLRNGITLGRASGMTSMHRAYVLSPGESHAVYVEFASEGFDWDDVDEASVDFSNAILKDGRPLAGLPPIVAIR